MLHQKEIIWARAIIKAALSNQPIEDSRVELKSTWIEPDKAAHRLGAHANAARGDKILWLVGIDEKNHTIASIDSQELGVWYQSVERHFDGFAPRLLVDVNIELEQGIVVALCFETAREAPYVIKNSKPGGGYPQFIVPWREGTRLRAASREDLLRILLPIRRLSSLVDELDFNIAIGADGWGCPFRDEEFHRAMRDGALASLAEDVRQPIHDAYVAMGRANQIVSGTFSASLVGSSMSSKRNQAQKAVLDTLAKIESAREVLVAALRK
jgi:hypothetical protein